MAYEDDPLMQGWARQQLGYAPVGDTPGGYAPVDAPLPGEAAAAVERELGGDVGEWARRRPLPRYAGGPYSTEVAPTVGDPAAPAPPAPVTGGAPTWSEPPPHMGTPITPEEKAWGALDPDQREAIEQAQQQQRRPAGGGYVAPPPLSKLFQGGFMYPRDLDAARSEIETARLRGEVSDAEAEKMLADLPKGHAAWQRSVPGMQVELGRMGQDAAAEQGGIAATGLERRAAFEEQLGERYGRLQEDLRARQAEEAERERVRVEKLQEQEQRYEDAQREMRDFRIDPDRYMAKQSGWDKARIAIALFLGGVGASFSGGSNAALQMFQSKVDSDIEAQKAELAGKKDFVAGRQNVLGMMRQRFDDERVAEAAARKFMLDELTFEVEKMGQGLKSADQLQMRDQLLAQLQADRQMAEQQMAIGAQQLADVETQRRQQAAAWAAQARRRAAAGVTPVKGDFGDRAIMINGRPVGVAPTKEQAQAISRAAAARDGLNQQIDGMINLARSSGMGDAIAGKFGMSEKSAQAQALSSSMLTTINRDFAKLGALSGGDLDLLRQQVPDPSQLSQFDADTIARLEVLRTEVNRALEAEMQSANVQPIVPIGHDDKGRQQWGLVQGGDE